MTHEFARALADAGLISVANYIQLCHENEWSPRKAPDASVEPLTDPSAPVAA